MKIDMALKLSIDNINKYLTAAVPLIGVIVFSVIFYQHTEALLVGQVEKWEFTNSEKFAEDYQNRVYWGLSSIGLFFTIALCCITSLYIIWTNFKRLTKESAWIIGILIVLVLIFVVYISMKEFDVGGSVTKLLFDDIKERDGINVNKITEWSMGTSFFAVLLNTFAMFTILLPKKNFSVMHLKVMLDQFKFSVYVTSLFLLAGIIQVFCLFKWVTPIFDLSTDNTQILSFTLSTSASIIYAITYLIMFAPVSVKIGDYSRNMAIKKMDSSNGENVEKWLKKEGLYRSPSQIIFSYLMLAGPTILSIVLKSIFS